MSNLEGAMLSDYLLSECISRGNVADVYRARQNDGQYEVAVKVFRPLYADREAFRAYFLQEAEKIGQFDHPHILPFIEYGEGEGLLYAVTPFVRSGTLDELLKKVGGKFSAMQAQPIVQQLCDAVQYAHEHDIIHGNIKPRNVFVANDGRMLLADFGIARGYTDGQQAPGKLEWSSIQYAAPEQSLGLLRRSSDIYSLGAIVFRLLTGSPVFVGQTPVEVLLKHVRQAPPLARSLVPDISEAVDDVLQKTLNKRSDDRYSTAMDLCRAYIAAVAFAPVASPVARSVNLSTHPLTPDPQTPQPASLLAITTQPTAPIPIFQASQTSVVSLSPELMQQSAPQPPVLPEQQGLTSVPYPEAARVPQTPQLPPASAPASVPAYWSHEPVEWSPLPQTQVPSNAGHIPAHAAEYVYHEQQMIQLPEREQIAVEEQPRKRGKWLPILVIILLLLGLLAALLSSFLLPSSAPQGTGAYRVPFALSGQVAGFKHRWESNHA
ncbi:MAG TPA: protein kinase [Ktedonobacteraceae bacterium]